MKYLVVPLLGMVTACGPAARFYNGDLVAADYWSDEPQILSAGMGFDGIIGLDDVNEDTVRDAGGAWYGLAPSLLTACATPPPVPRISSL